MSRLKFVVPAAVLMLAGALTASTAQAAPAAGMPEAAKAVQEHSAGVVKAHWRRHHHRRHHYHHHHHRHHHHHHRHHRHW